jgi:hypothetical protein
MIHDQKTINTIADKLSGGAASEDDIAFIRHAIQIIEAGGDESLRAIINDIIRENAMQNVIF